MDILLKHVLRSIAEKKFRTIIIVFAILLTTALLYINFNLRDVAIQSYTGFFKAASGTTDVIIHEKDSNFFTEKDVNLSNVSVEKKVPFIQYLGVYTEASGKGKRLVVKGMDKQEAIDTHLLEVNDATNGAFTGNHLIVSEKFADHYSYQMGDKVDIRINGEKQTFEIYGIAANTGLFMDETVEYQVLLSKGKLNELLGQKNAINGMYIDMANEQIDKTLEKLEKNNQAFTIQPTVNQTEIDKKTSNMSLVLLLALLLMLVLSGTVLSAMYKHIQNDRLPAIATFKSIGATKGTTSFLLIMETIVYGLIGGVLGVALAAFSMPYIRNMIIEGQSLEVAISFDWLKGVLSVALAIIIAIVITSATIMQVNKKSLKDSIFNTVAAPFKRSKIHTWFGVLIFLIGLSITFGVKEDSAMSRFVPPILTVTGFAMLVPAINHLLSAIISSIFSRISPTMMLAVKNNKINKISNQNIRVASIISALVISILSISIAFNTLINNTNTMRNDVLIVYLDALTANKDAKEVRRSKGVGETTSLFTTDGIVKQGGEEKTISIYGREPNDNFDLFFTDSIEIEKNTINNLANNEVILDKKVLEWMKLKKGDTLPIVVGGKEESFIIKDTMDSYKFSSASNTIFIKNEVFKEKYTTIPYMMYVTTSMNLKEQKAILEDALLDSHSTVITFDEFMENQQGMVNSLMFIINLVVMAGLVIGLMGILNNLVIGYITRKKEFAVLYSTAMNKKQLKTVIFLEIIIQCIVSLILCFVLSNVLVWQLNGVLAYLEVGVQLSYAFGTMFTIFIIILLIELVSSFYMFRIVNKLDVMKELRFE